MPRESTLFSCKGTNAVYIVLLFRIWSAQGRLGLKSLRLDQTGARKSAPRVYQASSRPAPATCCTWSQPSTGSLGLREWAGVGSNRSVPYPDGRRSSLGPHLPKSPLKRDFPWFGAVPGCPSWGWASSGQSMGGLRPPAVRTVGGWPARGRPRLLQYSGLNAPITRSLLFIIL